MPKLDYESESFLTWVKKALNDVFNAQIPIPDMLTAEEYEMAHGLRRTETQRILFAPFQPFYDASKDAKHVIKPYSRLSQFLEDLAQPIYGIGNLIKGVSLLTYGLLGIALITPFALLFSPLIIYMLCEGMTILQPDQKKSFVQLLALLIKGVSNILRGLTQIAATPLTWLFKIPCRATHALVNEIQDKPQPRIEDKDAVQQLFKSDNLESSDKAICKALHLEFLKGNEKGQLTDIDSVQEQRRYNNIENSPEHYLELYPYQRNMMSLALDIDPHEDSFPDEEDQLPLHRSI